MWDEYVGTVVAASEGKWVSTRHPTAARRELLTMLTLLQIVTLPKKMCPTCYNKDDVCFKIKQVAPEHLDAIRAGAPQPLRPNRINLKVRISCGNNNCPESQWCLAYGLKDTSDYCLKRVARIVNEGLVKKIRAARAAQSYPEYTHTRIRRRFRCRGGSRTTTTTS
jgi:hypothetical protein